MNAQDVKRYVRNEIIINQVERRERWPLTYLASGQPSASAGDAVAGALSPRHTYYELHVTLQTPVSSSAKRPPCSRKQPKTFAFDHCFYSLDSALPNFASQKTVFECLGRDILDNAFDGYNACIFAYGQTDTFANCLDCIQPPTSLAIKLIETYFVDYCISTMGPTLRVTFPFCKLVSLQI
ncbi:Kinesin-like protein KIF13B [Papilio machaon]|uniref:Kinesin-like protein KIF13B n=1 Tax=Papilio machaon TaxID=76193 RepID=A0A0N1I6F2_PAPMA|nr:Kinesin-like protein KIF13B [Papilio machaon]